jgi:fatty-acyl-CoA synthase
MTIRPAIERPRAYRDIRVGELLTLLARDYAENEALIYPDRAVRYSFGQLEELARRAAKGLLSIGVERGDRVALWAPNIPEWVVLQFALAKIGAILVTVNTSLRAPEIEYLLKQSESGTLIMVAGWQGLDFIEAIYGLIPELLDTGARRLDSARFPSLSNIIFVGEDAPEGMIRYDELQARSHLIADEELTARERMISLDDVINMQYTSGTTGLPKGVMLTSRNIVNNAYWIAERLAITPGDRLCLPVPLFHCFGCVMGVLGAYTHAASVIPLERFNPLRVVEYVERERCTVLYGVPTMFIAELEQLENRSFDLSSLRTGIMAGSPCPEPLMRRVIEKMNLTEMTISYGQTEASPGITLTPRYDSISLRTQTVGVALPEVEIKIVDPATGERCFPGQPGELCCRGYNVMKGYYNDPKATADAIDSEGWLHTGDLGTIDPEGYVRITGRIKDLIIRAGENIAPREIEDLLRRHNKIADAYVYGVPDERYGEVVAAAVRLKRNQTATRKEILEFCKDRIARFKIPRYIRFVDSFPMTASGKVQKFRLRDMHVRRTGNDLVNTAGSV